MYRILMTHFLKFQLENVLVQLIYQIALCFVRSSEARKLTDFLFQSSNLVLLIQQGHLLKQDELVQL